MVSLHSKRTVTKKIDIYKKPTANIILNRKKIETILPEVRNKKRMATILTLFKYYAQRISWNNKKMERI